MGTILRDSEINYRFNSRVARSPEGAAINLEHDRYMSWAAWYTLQGKEIDPPTKEEID